MQSKSEGILKFSTQYVDDIILLVTFFFLWHKLRHCTQCADMKRGAGVQTLSADIHENCGNF